MDCDQLFLYLLHLLNETRHGRKFWVNPLVAAIRSKVESLNTLFYDLRKSRFFNCFIKSIIIFDKQDHKLHDVRM